MAEFERDIEVLQSERPHLVGKDMVEPTLLPVDQPQHGTKVSELGYMAGGHGKLVEKAMVGKNGQLELSKNDLEDPKKISLIHPTWRDELDKGNKLVLHSWGKMDVVHPKTKEVVLFDGKK